jgi:hypothetical protein
MTKKNQEGPERRRALAEMNLIGQKGVKAKAKRRGCAQIFGLISLLAAAGGLVALWVGPH